MYCRLCLLVHLQLITPPLCLTLHSKHTASGYGGFSIREARPTNASFFCVSLCLSFLSSFTSPCPGQVLRAVEGHSYKHEFSNIFRQLELAGPRRQGNWRRKPGDLLPFLPKCLPSQETKTQKRGSWYSQPSFDCLSCAAFSLVGFNRS